ncbi:tRNA (adenosine(37)-N6)-dimethylallyltransferase MiaA [Candidatus Gottesmanbacteria bacterium]|nr:tRNA (adenosine(37)-N6)-dimethylallyltransferase MiaA [Candidatus Gottesmanbacteria bacterium]
MKLLVICGPTATGKTDLGIYLSKKFHGEIISADSRQVYRGMDINTGKDIPVNSKLKTQNSKLQIKNKKFNIGYRLKEGIPIWLVDIVEPDYIFNVGEYREVARKVIKDISKRNKLPIIVGGTGLYIKSLLYPLPLASIVPNQKLRDKLSKLNLDELQKYLQKINPRKWQSLNHSDQMNPRRLIRAIEISLSTISSPSSEFNSKHYLSIYEEGPLIIGLLMPKEKLNQRIDERINKRIKEGALEEVRKISQEKFSGNLPSLSSTGYKQLKNYLGGRITRSEAISSWQNAEHAFAKRQITWFKNMQGICWYDVSQNNYLEKIGQRIEKWYTESH